MICEMFTLICSQNLMVPLALVLPIFPYSIKFRDEIYIILADF